MTQSLGQCSKCYAALCFSGSDVVCMACGLPQPEHPLMVERAEAAAKGQPLLNPRGHELKSFPTTPIELAATWLDRIKILEDKEKAQFEVVKQLRKEVADLRTLLESTGRRKTG